MPVLKMERKAADNTYLHRDFHNILNLGLDDLRDRFGVRAVADYLRRFTLHFYAPLIKEIRDDVRKGSLDAVIRRFEEIYRAEDAEDVLSFEKGRPGELLVRIRSCPAVTHMHKSQVEPSPCFSLTSSVLWQTIAEASDLGYAILGYDAETGAATHLFYLDHPGHQPQNE